MAGQNASASAGLALKCVIGALSQWVIQICEPVFVYERMSLGNCVYACVTYECVYVSYVKVCLHLSASVCPSVCDSFSKKP